MNKNIKLAKELIKIAKSLVGSSKEYNAERTYISLSGPPVIQIYVTGVNEFQLKKILKIVERETGGQTQLYYRYGYKIMFNGEGIQKDENTEPFKTVIKVFQNNGFRRNKELEHTELDSLTNDERNKYEEEQMQGKEKKAQIGWDSRGNERQVWLSLQNVTTNQKKQVHKQVYDACRRNGLDYVEMKNGEINFHMFGGDVSKSEYKEEPFKTIIEVLQKNGFKVINN